MSGRILIGINISQRSDASHSMYDAKFACSDLSRFRQTAQCLVTAICAFQNFVGDISPGLMLLANSGAKKRVEDVDPIATSNRENLAS